VATAKRKLPKCRLFLSGVLRRRYVSWRRIGALNDGYDRLKNALGLTFVVPNSWIEDGDFARDWLHLKGRGKRRLGQLYVTVSGLDVGGLAVSKMWQIMENGNYRTRDTMVMGRSVIDEIKTLHADAPVTSILMSREGEVGSRVISVAEESASKVRCLLCCWLSVGVFIIKQ